MENKGFADNKTNIETPNDGVIVAEKPLKNGGMRPNRVDINVLKSKLQETESKEFKKNLFILTTLVLSLGILGIYLSLWWDLQKTNFRALIELWKIQKLALKIKLSQNI